MGGGGGGKGCCLKSHCLILFGLGLIEKSLSLKGGGVGGGRVREVGNLSSTEFHHLQGLSAGIIGCSTEGIVGCSTEGTTQSSMRSFNAHVNVCYGYWYHHLEFSEVSQGGTQMRIICSHRCCVPVQIKRP